LFPCFLGRRSLFNRKLSLLLFEGITKWIVLRGHFGTLGEH
jgi:hypothetical protein